MPMKLHTRLASNEAVTAGGVLRVDDLPVNPLSVILLTIRAEVSAANTLPTLANLLGVFSRIEVVYKGQNIISGSPADLWALAYYLLGRSPHVGRMSDAAANARVWLTLPILLGRRPFDLTECFPSVRRGELQLQCTPASSFTAITNVTIQIETIELLEAQPAGFLKVTTASKTPAATGDHDVDLPIGNDILGVILFGTTVPVDAAFTASIQTVKTLVDNVEWGYPLAQWETLRGHEALWCDQPWQDTAASVRLGGGAPAANDLSEALQWPTALLRQYAALNFELQKGAGFPLVTEGRARINLRINAGAADAIRVLPVEYIKTAQAVTS
jgi:hypothetical protein